MQFRKSSIAIAAIALFGALPLAAQAQSTPAPTSGSLDVWFKAPRNGSTVSGTLNGGTSCYANTSGPVARVVFSVDGAALNTDSAPADGTQCILDTTRFKNGTHQLRADAYDSRGNRKSDIVRIDVQNTAANTAPTVSMTGPASGQTVSGSAPYSASASDNGGVARVDFFLDGATTRLASDTAAPYGGTLDTTALSNGAHTLKALAYDAQGLSSSSQVSFNVSNNKAPSVSISGPASGQTVSGSLAYSANASDDQAVARVDFSLDGSALLSDTGSPYGGTLDTTRLANGTHTLKAVAFDAQGLNATAQVSFNVSNTTSTSGGSTGTSSTPAPSSGSLDVWFKAPAAGATISGVLNGGTSCYSNSSGAVARVVYTLDSSALNTDSTPADGTQCTLDTTKFANGTHQLRALALDASGNAMSDVISVNVQNSSTPSGGTTSGGTTSGGTTGGATGGTTGTPYTGTAIALPAVLPAANFDKGGEGVAYHDLSTGNSGGVYRTSESVDIVASSDAAGGPYQVTNFQNGEWANYTVALAQAGNFDIGIRAANNYGTGAFHIEVDGTNVTGSVAVPKTGAWTSYQWFGKQGVPLSAGAHVVKLVAETQWFNVSAVSLQASASTSSGSTSPSGSTALPASMLFWSGFESSTGLATPNDCYGNGCWQNVTGGDAATGFQWPSALGVGAIYQLISNSGTMPTSSSIGNYVKNELQTVTGHKGTPTTAMASTIYQSGCCGTGSQTPADGSTQNPMLMLPKADVPEMYISQWMMLQPDLAQKMSGGTWRELFEWKTTDTDARIELQVKSDGGNGLYWMARSDSYQPSYNEFWRVNNTAVPVPVGRWFKLEVYWKRGSGTSGRVFFAVDGQVIADRAGNTIGPNKSPINRIMVNQLYSGSSYPIYHWVDDLQIWSTFPSARQGDAWYDPPYASH